MPRKSHTSQKTPREAHPNPRAAIFDVDGTLIDSVDFHAKAWQEALAAFGHRVSFRAVRAQIGKGGDQLLPAFLTRGEINSYGEEVMAHRRKLFAKKYLRRLKPFPQVRALFQRLHAAGWKLAVASSAEKREVEYYLRLCRVHRLVDAAISADDADKSKPHPDIFKATMRKLRIPSARHCVVIGDSPYDAIAARRAHIAAIGFLSGGFGRPRLKAVGCRYIYKGPADLLKRYANSTFEASPTPRSQRKGRTAPPARKK